MSRKAWTLPSKLQELKKYPRKTCGFGQPRGHLIRVLTERSVTDGGDFCLLWLVIILTRGKVEFVNKLISETFCLMDLLNSR